MFSKISNRILDIIMHEFSGKTFSVCMMSGLTGFVQSDLKKGVSFHYVVPEHLCRKYTVEGRKVDPHFSTAAIMALFDEISTYSTSMKDKNHRPGLSVHLTTELLQNVYAGDEVTILTKADKNGKTIGYCTMELLNKKGELVARGKHIRYLQMGALFDTITDPMILPWTVNYYEYFHGKRKANSGDIPHSGIA